MCVALTILQRLALSSAEAGTALVAYYRQLLPMCSLFWNTAPGGAGDANGGGLGKLIAETLALLEARGGVDALINIKYMCPKYQSCC